MYAVIEACGKQYKVTKGDVIFFEKLEEDEGKKVTFDKVVLLSDEGKIEIGTPYVKGIKVEGKVIAHGKGKKIIVFKYKAKKNYKRKQGHRQPYTKVEITAIKLPSTKTEKEAEEKVVETEAKTTTKKATAKKTSAETKTTVKKTTVAKKEKVEA